MPRPFHNSNKRRAEELEVADGKPYDRLTFRGVPMNRRTAALVLKVEGRLGYELTVTQGSYNPGGVEQSAGTHDGGGALDLAPYDWRRKCKVFRLCGGDAWHRLPSQGDWSEHIHVIVHGDREASAGAKAQMVAYENHRNGLASNLPDKFRPHPDPAVRFDFAEWRREVLADERARVRVNKAVARAVNALVNLRKTTDAKADKAEIQKYIEGVRAHRH